MHHWGYTKMNTYNETFKGFKDMELKKWAAKWYWSKKGIMNQVDKKTGEKFFPNFTEEIKKWHNSGLTAEEMKIEIGKIVDVAFEKIKDSDNFKMNDDIRNNPTDWIYKCKETLSRALIELGYKRDKTALDFLNSFPGSKWELTDEEDRKKGFNIKDGNNYVFVIGWAFQERHYKKILSNIYNDELHKKRKVLIFLISDSYDIGAFMTLNEVESFIDSEKRKFKNTSRERESDCFRVKWYYDHQRRESARVRYLERKMLKIVG